MKPTKQQLLHWLRKSVPIFILRYMLLTRTTRVCGMISEAFAAVSNHFGIPTYVVAAPGHFYNVVLTQEGAIEVDLSIISFQLDKYLTGFEYSERDPYGDNFANRKALQDIFKNPFRAIRIRPYEGSIKRLKDSEYPEEMTQELVNNFWHTKKEIKLLRNRDSFTQEWYQEMGYKKPEDFESEFDDSALKFRKNPKF